MKYTKFRNQLLITVAILFFTSLSSCNEDPYIVHYEGFTCSSDEVEYVFESGSNGSIDLKIIAENGLKRIKVKIGSWTGSDSGTEETIEIKGSPKTYNFSYSFDIPDNANLDTELTFLLDDYAGKTVEYKVNVTTLKDEENPIINIEKPVIPDNKFSPLEKVPFQVTITDNKKIKEAVLSCEAISYSKTFKPANVKDKSITITEFVDIPEEGTYTFNLKAYDAQNNLVEQDIPVIVSVGSKPAIVDLMTTPLTGVSGGKLPFHFKVTTDKTHVISTVKIEIASPDITTSKTFSPNTQSVNLEDVLDIPSSADAHDKDLKITVTATNDIGESSQWTGNSSIIKNVYIFGKGTVAKGMMGYSMPMKHQTGTNLFVYKTFVEAINEGFRFWSGTFSVNSETRESTAVPIWSWGKKDNENMLEGNETFVTAGGTGYYIITFDPVTLSYSVKSDTDVPSTPEEEGIYSQVNNLLYKSGNEWVTSNWNFIKFNAFPNNVHRFYMDVKTNGSGWTQAFFGLAAQAGADGTMYSVVGGAGGWTYTFDGFACSLEKKYSWAGSGQISEKGSTPNGTMFRMVVDTYLMQMSWAPISAYSYPAATN
ncbi:MAG: hypothetical protein ACK5MK_08920 [Dysgonomonas sp.]